jgi:hypothetical protein
VAIEYWKNRIVSIVDISDTFLPQFIRNDERIYRVSYYDLNDKLRVTHVIIRKGEQHFTDIIGYAVKEIVEGGELEKYNPKN